MYSTELNIKKQIDLKNELIKKKRNLKTGEVEQRAGLLGWSKKEFRDGRVRAERRGRVVS